MSAHKIGPHPTNSWLWNDSEVDISRNEPRKILKVKVVAKPKNICIDLNRTAIVVIDMQNDFCAVNGYLSRCGFDCGPARDLITPINTLLRDVRVCKVPIVWLNWAVRYDRLNIAPSMPSLHIHSDKRNKFNSNLIAEKGGWGSVEGQWGAQIVDGLEANENDIYIRKQRFSGFFNTDFDSILRNMNITTLFFAGVASDICVLATLQDAMSLGYDVVIMEDCVATNSPHYCVKATEYHVMNLYGFISTSTSLMSGIHGLE